MGGASVRQFSIGDVRNWEQVAGQQIYYADLIDASAGYRMSAMYWRIGRGEQAPVAIPTDEVWIVTRGGLALRTGDDVIHVGPGEVLRVPKLSPGTAEALADAHLLTLAHPPSWQLDEEAWDTASGAAPATAPVTKLAAGSGDEHIDGFGLDVHMGPAGDNMSPSDDEVVVVTTGALLVSGAGEELTVRAGELVYAPAGHAPRLQAVEPADVVVVRR